MGSAYILKSSGKVESLDHRPSLSEAQKIVGGYIEIVPIQGRMVTLVVNEEGRLLGLPLNPDATELFQYSPICGDVIVLEGWKTVGK